jgi:hypothetical protein
VDSRLGLVEQIAELRRQVAAIEEQLTAPTLADKDNQERLSDAKARLLRVCGVRQQELLALKSQVCSNGFTHDLWATLSKLRRSCRALAGDCMALEQRVSLRGSKRVAAMGMAADLLAEELSEKVGHPRTHYAVVSDAEHYGADTSAIHLSYARLDLWNLSRAVHEFGHLWAEEFASNTDGAESAFIRSLGKEWNIDQAKEFFADIVAAFLLGPAYGYSCLLLDFSPADSRGSDTHPSDDERALLILAALRELVKEFNPITGSQLKQRIADLEKYWSDARAAAGAAGPPSVAVNLDYMAGLAMRRLNAEISQARYGSMALAYSVSTALANEAGVRPAPAGGADILNGAWLSRLDRPHETLEIGRRALAMFANP